MQVNNDQITAKQYLLSIIGNSPNGIIVIDLSGIITIINQTALDFLNLPHNVNYYIDKAIFNIIDTIPILREVLHKCIRKKREEFDLEQIPLRKSILISLVEKQLME